MAKPDQLKLTVNVETALRSALATVLAEPTDAEVNAARAELVRVHSVYLPRKIIRAALRAARKVQMEELSKED